MKKYIVSRVKDDEDEKEELTDKEKIEKARKNALNAYNLLVECKNFLKSIETPVVATIDKNKEAIQKTLELSNMINDDSVFENIFGEDDFSDDSINDSESFTYKGVLVTLTDYGWDFIVKGKKYETGTDQEACEIIDELIK